MFNHIPIWPLDTHVGVPRESSWRTDRSAVTCNVAFFSLSFFLKKKEMARSSENSLKKDGKHLDLSRGGQNVRRHPLPLSTEECLVPSIAIFALVPKIIIIKASKTSIIF